MSQLSLDELAVSAPLADMGATEGMSDALRAERVQVWKEAAGAWLERRAPGETFIADDLVAAVGLPDSGPARNNVVGAWISAQSKAGRIAFAGEMRKSERVIGHGNLLRVWRVA